MPCAGSSPDIDDQADILIAFTFALAFAILQECQPYATRAAAANTKSMAGDDVIFGDDADLGQLGRDHPSTLTARAATVVERVLDVMYVAFLIWRPPTAGQSRELTKDLPAARKPGGASWEGLVRPM